MLQCGSQIPGACQPSSSLPYRRGRAAPQRLGQVRFAIWAFAETLDPPCQETAEPSNAKAQPQAAIPFRRLTIVQGLSAVPPPDHNASTAPPACPLQRVLLVRAARRYCSIFIGTFGMCESIVVTTELIEP